MEAAKAAHTHSFIAVLPQGYQTLVGERGVRLSGGERQRLSLARAFLKDAPILILDEPTSALEVKTESGIVEVMASLMQNRTTFLFAHRLTTLQHCDIRIVLDGGRLTVLEPDEFSSPVPAALHRQQPAVAELTHATSYAAVGAGLPYPHASPALAFVPP